MWGVVLVCVLSTVLWYRTFVFYAPDQTLSGGGGDDSPYSVGVYRRGGTDGVMIHVRPQNVHFFVEDGGKLLYQPVDDDDDAAACPGTHPERAFVVSSSSFSSVCRRRLSFLKANVYTDLTYARFFPDVRHPLTVLRRLIHDGILPDVRL